MRDPSDNYSLDNGRTWIEPEEFAYPAGSLARSRRHAMAECDGGIVRKILIGIPNTAFSIPGRVKVKRESISGILINDNGTFRFSSAGKNKLVNTNKGE